MGTGYRIWFLFRIYVVHSPGPKEICKQISVGGRLSEQPHLFKTGREIKAYKATLTISHSNQTLLLITLKRHIAASALPPDPLTLGAAHEYILLC